jgi:hypothetical protein
MIKCRCGKTIPTSEAHPVVVDDGRGWFKHYLYLCAKCYVAWIGAEKSIWEMIDWIPTGADLK